MNCPHFSSCSAPLCPLDPSSLLHAAWFPIEDICIRNDYGTDPKYRWIKVQRKMKNRSVPFEAGAFTVDMLLRVNKVTVTMEGLKDLKNIKELESWMNKHPVKKEMSEEKKQILRERMNKARASKGQ
jgi:hypothetical protein